MLPKVGIPKLVEYYSLPFYPFLEGEGFMYFKRYLSGLIISENKTVQGMNQHSVIAPKGFKSKKVKILTIFSTAKAVSRFEEYYSKKK